MDNDGAVFALLIIGIIALIVGLLAWSYHYYILHNRWVQENLDKDCDPVAQDFQGRITAFKCPKGVEIK